MGFLRETEVDANFHPLQLLAVELFTSLRGIIDVFEVDEAKSLTFTRATISDKLHVLKVTKATEFFVKVTVSRVLA
jgi:hypothetical protein